MVFPRDAPVRKVLLLPPASGGGRCLLMSIFLPLVSHGLLPSARQISLPQDPWDCV